MQKITARLLSTALIGLIVVSSTVYSLPKLPNSTIGFAWHQEYDKEGRLVKLTDVAKHSIELQHEKDARGRITKTTKTFNDKSKVIYHYDRHQRLSSISDPNGKTSFEYNSTHHLTAVKRQGYPALKYDYDTRNNLALLQIGKDYTIRYAHDFLGRLKTMDTPAGKITYDYRPGINTFIRILPNGLQTRRLYYPNGNLKSITHSKGKYIIAQFKYRYRADGLISTIEEIDTNRRERIKVEYDSQQQIVRAKSSRNGITDFSYR